MRNFSDTYLIILLISESISKTIFVWHWPKLYVSKYIWYHCKICNTKKNSNSYYFHYALLFLSFQLPNLEFDVFPTILQEANINVYTQQRCKVDWGSTINDGHVCIGDTINKRTSCNVITTICHWRKSLHSSPFNAITTCITNAIDTYSFKSGFNM